MREISRNVPFFIYFERYYGQHTQFCVLTKTWIIVKTNPTGNEARQPPVKSLPSNPSQAKGKSALDIVARKLEEIAIYIYIYIYIVYLYKISRFSNSNLFN